MPHADKEVRKRYQAEYAKKNEVRLRQWRKDNYDKNRARKQQWQKEYCEAHRAEISERKKSKWHNATSEEVAARRVKQQKYWRERGSKLHRARLIKRYGLTIEQYQQMLVAQDCRCAICRKPISEENRGITIDHDHETGEVRGLLCQKCNLAIGLFDEDILIFQSAIEYLKKASSKNQAA